ncbi:hypothetical protein ACI8AC_00270 [Geodermatophilus sp. SYSU D00758]
MQELTVQERFVRACVGVVAASALAYPLVLASVRLLVAQLLVVDVAAVVVWLCVGIACSVGAVAALRWGAARRVRSPWLLAGLLPPAAFELWVLWPLLTA